MNIIVSLFVYDYLKLRTVPDNEPFISTEGAAPASTGSAMLHRHVSTVAQEGQTRDASTMAHFQLSTKVPSYSTHILLPLSIIWPNLAKKTLMLFTCSLHWT